MHAAYVRTFGSILDSFFQRHTLHVQSIGICFFSYFFITHPVMMAASSQGNVTLLCYQVVFLLTILEKTQYLPFTIGSQLPCEGLHRRMSWGNTFIVFQTHVNRNRKAVGHRVEGTQIWPQDLSFGPDSWTDSPQTLCLHDEGFGILPWSSFPVLCFVSWVANNVRIGVMLSSKILSFHSQQFSGEQTEAANITITFSPLTLTLKCILTNSRLGVCE